MVRGLWLHISSVPLVSAAAQSRSSVLASPRIGCDNALDAWSLLRLRIFIINDLLCVCVCAPSLPPESHFQYPDFGSTLIIGPQSLETCWRLNHPEASWSHLLTQPLISGTTGKAPLSWRRRHPSPDHLAQGQGSRALKPRKDRCGGDAERKKETWRRGALYRAFFSFMTHINTFCWFFWLLVILWRLNHQHVVDKFNMPWLSGLEIDCYDLTVGTWIISPCRMWWSRATGWSCSQIWSCRKLPTTPGKCNSEPPVLASSSRRLRMRKNHPNAIKTRKSQVEMGQFQEK